MGIGESVHGEASNKKTDTNKPASIMIGTVAENWDKDHPGKVKVNIRGDANAEAKSEWMPVAAPYAANKCGFYMLPEKGSTVVIGFIDDNSVSPVVIGSLWLGTDTSAIPENAADENNIFKIFCTQSGHMIKFSEKEDENSIEIISSSKQRIFLDDKEEKIVFSSGSDDNKITIDGQNGNIVVDAKTSFSVKIDGSEAMKITSSETAVKSSKFSYKGDTLDFNGNQSKIEGATVNVKSSGNLNIESSGIATVKGSMLKLN